MYSFGISALAEKKTRHEKYVAPKAILVLFDHNKFYCDKAEGDRSKMVWVDHKWGLVLTLQQCFRLREVGTSNSWSMDTKQLKLIRTIL